MTFVKLLTNCKFFMSELCCQGRLSENHGTRERQDCSILKAVPR